MGTEGIGVIGGRRNKDIEFRVEAYCSVQFRSRVRPRDDLECTVYCFGFEVQQVEPFEISFSVQGEDVDIMKAMLYRKIRNLKMLIHKHNNYSWFRVWV